MVCYIFAVRISIRCVTAYDAFSCAFMKCMVLNIASTFFIWCMQRYAWFKESFTVAVPGGGAAGMHPLQQVPIIFNMLCVFVEKLPRQG